MAKQVYSVYDAAVGFFMQPFFVDAKGQAVRAFMDEVSSGQGPLSKHYKDFTLFRVASFDENSGQFYQLGEPERVISGLEVMGSVARNGAASDVSSDQMELMARN